MLKPLLLEPWAKVVVELCVLEELSSQGDLVHLDTGGVGIVHLSFFDKVVQALGHCLVLLVVKLSHAEHKILLLVE